MAGSTQDPRIFDGVFLSEKHIVEENVIHSPPSELDQPGIVQDWNSGEETSVRRK
jgi:nitrate reductase alpha subunit